jgi:hypothetical protein
MYGPAVYATDSVQSSSRKARCGNQRVAVKIEADMGKMAVSKHADPKGYHRKAGYDSLHAPSGTDVRNSEYAIYNTKNITSWSVHEPKKNGGGYKKTEWGGTKLVQGPDGRTSQYSHWQAK